MSLYMGQTKIPDVRIGGGGPQTAVLYTPMEPELKPEEKQQARKNIGATDISLGLTGMAVGDQIEVAEVDENGVPTAWKPEGTWRLIEKIKLASDEVLLRTKEPDGTPYNFKKAYVKIKLGTSSKPLEGTIQIRKSGGVALVSSFYYMRTYGKAGSLYAAENSGRYQIAECQWQDKTWQLQPTVDSGKNITFSVTSITAVVSSAAMPAGTEIEIWAVSK